MAYTTRSSDFPYKRLVSVNLYLACLHSSVYHGASVLPHLLGFFGTVILICFTTYALIAYYNKYASTFAARSSLEIALLLIMASNPVIKTGVLVCCFHLSAELA